MNAEESSLSASDVKRCDPGIEPGTYHLPVDCSTTELIKPFDIVKTLITQVTIKNCRLFVGEVVVGFVGEVVVGIGGYRKYPVCSEKANKMIAVKYCCWLLTRGS